MTNSLNQARMYYVTVSALAVAAILCVTEAPAATAGKDESAAKSVISLAGQWRFALDANDQGTAEKWFARRLGDTVTLPGTTDENHKGIFKDEHAVDRLSRVWYWKGPAWYQKDVTIPDAWKGKHVTLLLERTKNTRVWVDETFCGWDDTLSAMQVFDVSAAMSPGRHTITVLVDNAKLPPVGPAHAVDERTQTNWNGIVGRIELRATEPVWLDDVQVYPDVARRTALVRAKISNILGRSLRGTIEISGESYNTSKTAKFPGETFPVRVEGGGSTVELTYKLGDGAPLWDEFDPAMIRLQVDFALDHSKDSHGLDCKTVCFGLRDFSTRRAQFTINGRVTFLRGKHDACIFPLTGYPPMDKAGWLRVLGISKSYGINHYRFHSWCPPEAAFEAADELGMYLQPEVPNKRDGFKAPEDPNAAVRNIDRLDISSTKTKVTLYDYAKREGELIFRDFGNHPSFVMFTLGNELDRDEGMFELVRHFHEIDPRHLYAQGSNCVHWNPSQTKGDDFWVTSKTRKDLPVRGSFFQGGYADAFIENHPPSTMEDFHESIAGVSVPVVGHEVGQYQVSPDFGEIARYTGVLRARNLEIFRDRLRDANMLDQTDAFVRASGALSVICYRQDIEAALRTPGFGGFQLLDLQDFPGQGTALVGILNAFMESKGQIAPVKWRQFCGPVVPLLRMGKFTWTSDECFVGRVQVANYGPEDLPGAEIDWMVTDTAGHRVAGGSLGPRDIRQGNVRDAGMFCLPLGGASAPGKLTITLAIAGTSYVNSYPIWVYPPKVDTAVPAGVTVARTLDADTLARLNRGETVLLLPEMAALQNPGKSIAGSFQCDFWCWPMFKRAAERRHIPVAPGTLGILCDPNVPALAGFPTEFHSDWQWWQLVKHSRPIILDSTPAGYRPAVQVIDNFARNHKLGLIFETRVGKGKLLACAIDLPAIQDKPEGRQMLAGLLRYAASPTFEPKARLDESLLRRLFGKGD